MADHDAHDHTGIPGVGAPTEILDIPTAEMDDSLVLAPDGAGGVEFRAEASGPAYAGWTPALTAVTTPPTLGSGSTAGGRYIAHGKHVTAYGAITFGTSGTNAGSGAYRISTPTTMRTSVNADMHISGHGYLVDASTSAIRHVFLSYVTTTTVQMWVVDGSSNVTHAAPWAWAASDILIFWLDYEEA